MRKILVHGGAGPLKEDVEEYIRGVEESVREGFDILNETNTALDAVVKSVEVMENNPIFNAGKGSVLTSEKTVEMGAAVMDGFKLQAGGTALVSRVKNPVILAKKIMENSQHVLIIGKGAESFAKSQDIELISPEELITPRSLKRLEEKVNISTVGAVAIDDEGRLAAATSTGGITMKHPGRVGDTPLIGAGNYANKYGAVSCTGTGESFMRCLTASRIVDKVEQGMPCQDAVVLEITRLEKQCAGSGGVICIDKNGNIGIYHNTPLMSWAWKTNTEEKSGMKTTHTSKL